MRVVLSRPSHPGNIGATARAMKTMGFTELALVQPRFFPTLAVGFSARGRDRSHPPIALRAAAPAILEAAATGRVALVFGNETSGLSNDELLRCQRLVCIPANPEYSSLNLAAAVQVACYELATAARTHALPAAGAGESATGDDARELFEHFESAVRESGYIDPDKPGRFMESMRRLLARSGLEREEVKMLHGMLAAFEKRMRR